VQFAEVFLRLGSSLVAWMVLYAHFLWLAALYAMGCGSDGDEMHRLLLGLAPITCGFAFALQLTRPFPDIHRILRWLGVPIIFLLLLASRSVWQVFARVSLESLAICGSDPPSGWQLLWPMTQLVTMLVAAYMIFSVWKSTVSVTSTSDGSQN
jgi:hypothetical protein